MADTSTSWLAENAAGKKPGQWRRKGVDGPPYVTDPSGDLVKSGDRQGLPKLVLYGRPSGRGKIIENTYNLQKWGERMAMWGAILDPQIVTDAGAISDEMDSQQWRQAMDGIVVRAKDAARAMIAAHRGTHIHTLTEDDDEDRRWINRLIAGEELGISAAAQTALVQAWRRMLALHGFEILAVEAPVVCDRWKVAGTLDRIVRLTRDMTFTTTNGERVTLPAGTVLILDLKTGKMTLDRGIIQYWQGYAVQLAAYALGVPYDVDREERGTWPFEVSTEWAIIAHLDVLAAIEEGEARCTLVLCDLGAGIRAGDLCMQAVAWGKDDTVFSPPACNLEMIVTVPVETTELRSQAVDRVRALIAAGHGEALTYAWPAGVPGLKEEGHTPEQLVSILAAVRKVEDDNNMPFHPADQQVAVSATGEETASPSADAGAPVADTALPDEGVTVGPTLVGDLADELGQLTDRQRQLIGRIAREANDADRSISLSVLPSERRLTIANALIYMVTVTDADESICRALITAATERPIESLGAAVGAFTIDEAERLAELTDQLGNDLAVVFADDGTVTLTPTPLSV